MYYIVETYEQLSMLEPVEYCFVDVITLNDQSHPKLTSPCVIYYNNGTKGYIFPINHSETFELGLDLVEKFLSQHKAVFCIDIKFTSYFLSNDNLEDVVEVILNKGEAVPDLYCDTKIQRDYYNKFYHKSDLNRVLPISKLYEKSECLYEKIAIHIGPVKVETKSKKIARIYKEVEMNGIRLNEELFNKHFETSWSGHSIKDGIIYTSYNLHNITGRPTNSFNSINFLAINKDNGSRKAFIPKNDAFVEFDFEAYHLKLIAKIVRYEFDSSESVHSILGKQYFKTEKLTDEQYAKSKELSFRMIYGGIYEEYKNIPFFKKISAFIEHLWEKYINEGYITLLTGRRLYFNENMNPQKLFNYLLQNAETAVNISILENIQTLCKELKSFVTLVVYDSLLVDFSFEDGKDILQQIKHTIIAHGLTCTVKYGTDYSSLRKLNYL